jgi:cell division protein FtsN
VAAKLSQKEAGFYYLLVAACSIFFFVVGVFFGSRQVGVQPVQEMTSQESTLGNTRAGGQGTELAGQELETGGGPASTKETAQPGILSEDIPAVPIEQGSEAPPTSEVAESPDPVGRSQTATRLYTVQVGAHRTRQEAEQVVQQLSTKGYSSRIVQPSGTVPFHRVCVGETISRQQADSLAEQLEKDGFNIYVRPVETGELD